MSKKYLLFDLDGTITASDEGITKCVQYALSHFGIDEPDLDKLKVFVGPPLRVAFPKYYGLSHDDTEKAVALYRSRYADIGIFECSVYEGVPELLRRCRDAGYTLILATSKPRVYAQRILEHFDLAQYFTHTVGCELDGTLDNKADIISYAMSLYPNSGKDDFVMIGDRFYDVDGAKENGIMCIGVLYGYGSRTELETAGADAVFTTTAELGDYLVTM